MLDALLAFLVLVAALQLLLVVAARVAARRAHAAGAGEPARPSTPSIEAWRSALPRRPTEGTEPVQRPALVPPPPRTAARPPERHRRRGAPHRAVAARQGVVWATLLGPCRAAVDTRPAS